jgi:hypothetical protein
MRKSTVVIFNQLNMKKIKSTKIILRKKQKKSLKKTMLRNTVAIHSVLKKKTKKINSQPVQ